MQLETNSTSGLTQNDKMNNEIHPTMLVLHVHLAFESNAFLLLVPDQRQKTQDDTEVVIVFHHYNDRGTGPG